MITAVSPENSISVSTLTPLDNSFFVVLIVAQPVTFLIVGVTIHLGHGILEHLSTRFGLCYGFARKADAYLVFINEPLALCFSSRPTPRYDLMHLNWKVMALDGGKKEHAMNPYFVSIKYCVFISLDYCIVSLRDELLQLCCSRIASANRCSLHCFSLQGKRVGWA